jgi:hypothetical protein
VRATTKKHTIKQDIIDDFLLNRKLAEEEGFNYMPSGVLKYYLFKGKFSTYAGRIIREYCKMNNIQIIRAGKLGIKTWQEEHIHQNMAIYQW